MSAGSSGQARLIDHPRCRRLSAKQPARQRPAWAVAAWSYYLDGHADGSMAICSAEDEASKLSFLLR